MDVHPTENVSIGIDPSSNGKKTSGYRVKYYDLPRLRGEMLDHIGKTCWNWMDLGIDIGIVWWILMLVVAPDHGFLGFRSWSWGYWWLQILLSIYCWEDDDDELLFWCHVLSVLGNGPWFCHARQLEVVPVRSCARQGIKSLTLFNYQKQRNDLDKVGLPPSFFFEGTLFLVLCWDFRQDRGQHWGARGADRADRGDRKWCPVAKLVGRLQ